MGESPKLKVQPSDPCEVDFTWYQMIRVELLRKTVGQAKRVLDVGCSQGKMLFMLSKQIATGVGVDIQKNDIVIAERARKKRGIRNLKFRCTNAVDLPFASKSFDVVLCLGDVLCYPNLYEYQKRVFSETKRVLKNNGLAIHNCMNWDWEYRLSPYWTFFTRTDKGHFYFHRTKRTPSGREICHNYEVIAKTPLHAWILRQDWPVGSVGINTSLNIIEKELIPQRWLSFQGVSKHQHYTPRRLKRKYENAGFQCVEVFAYGQMYDIVSKAGLLDTVGYYKTKLAKAEAEMAFQLRTGSGPWLFLMARK